ncbi:thioredoxin domain-containing protein 12-like [Fopius arisanus]|uniref:Thioredoxin domain-containing protein 12-like n=1 Tax=Fopius arisanus TaxID=64838 RepID=A0A9R1TMX8_9HYME|nr:PREDICTED: thioredoxin domain-containing protein 12-like [Fopius arisanus]
MRQYLKYFWSTGIIGIAEQVIETLLVHGVEYEFDYGFGNSYKWRNLSGGFEEAKKSGKPIFLIIHKPKCPACIKLKDKFSRSVKLIDISQHFVMINVENSSELIKSDEFSPDGKYVPRILFFTSAGDFIKTAYNRHPDADPEHRYFYSSPVQIIQVMQQVIDNSGRNPQ